MKIYGDREVVEVLPLHFSEEGLPPVDGTSFVIDEFLVLYENKDR